MEVKMIRTHEQYQIYLNEVRSILSSNPRMGTRESDRLEVLTILIEAYENSKFPVEPPDPVDAILFRMQEKGLRQVDLIPFFGTSSRVSEVLGRKRPLTVQMIKALSVGLGLSADTLVGVSVSGEGNARKRDVDWEKFPVAEMVKRGWLNIVNRKNKQEIEDAVKEFLVCSGLQLESVAFRRTLSGNGGGDACNYALQAWLARVIQKAREKKNSIGLFDCKCLTNDFLKEVAQFSRWEKGPLLAIEYLEKNGIAVVIESHLKGTLLDGAAIRDVDGVPIIGLTLRYDRLDSFWFTLLHELAHVWKHISENDTFLDDLNASSEDHREVEANRLARDAFIPRVIWKRSEAFLVPSKDSIEQFARKMKIHPAVVAGRVRKETGNYGLFSDLVGQGCVKRLFFF